MEDVLTKATADGVRIYALCTTNLVQEAAKKHGCSHLASAALGRAMNGALLLAATMKFSVVQVWVSVSMYWSAPAATNAS